MRITHERLRELLHYDPESGVFTWLVRATKNIKIGDEAGDRDTHGYLAIRIDGKRYRAHRLAWLYMTGAWPVHEIDHINGIRDDNRLGNLREATRAENQQNQAVRRDSSSGFTGVSWDKWRNKWQAYIKIAGRQRYLGRFPTAESAHAAYLAAKMKLHTFNPEVRMK